MWLLNWINAIMMIIYGQFFYLISISIQSDSHSVLLSQRWKPLVHCQELIALHMKKLKVKGIRHIEKVIVAYPH